MAKSRNIRREPRKLCKLNFSFGDISFVGILVISGISAFLKMQQIEISLLLGLLGAILAISNIRRNEELKFMLAITALVVVSTGLLLISIPAELQLFITNLIIAFGISGFVVAFGFIFRLGWRK